MNWEKTLWDKETYQALLDHLTTLTDEQYKAFNAKLIPDAPDLLGIRVPVLRSLAKEIAKGDWQAFLEVSDSRLHEAVTLEGLVIGYAKCGYDEFCPRIRRFAEKVYNWAICDVPVSSFKLIRKHREAYLTEAAWMLKHENPWAQRVGIIILLDHYLEGEWLPFALQRIDEIDSGFYYVQMAQGWLVATAFAKDREATLAYLRNCRLNDTAFQMAVRKIRDSCRVTREDKELVRGLRK